MASSSSDPLLPSFFKVVRDPTAPHLTLPIAFVRSNLDKIPKKPILKTATGEHSWKMKIRKIGENYCFTLGWDKLVKDTQLRSTDILVFQPVDPLTFEVLFLDRYGCEKELPSNNNSDDDDEILSFQIVISLKTHEYTMVMPLAFVEGAGLENKKSVTLKDLNEKEWKIGLRAEIYDHTKYVLAKKWKVFRIHNELSDGDICTFEFDKKERVIRLTQIIRSSN